MSADAQQGMQHQEAGRLGEAIRLYESCLRAEPRQPEIWNNLGACLLAIGATPDAVACFRQARSLLSDPIIASNHLYALLHDWTSGVEDIAAEHCRYAATLPSSPSRQEDRDQPARKLRIGYLSPGFGAHAIYQFFRGVLEAHDTEAVDVFCYSTRENPDDDTKTLRRLCPNWFELCDFTDQQAVELIRSHRIHVLIDRGGYVQQNRVPLLAHQLAPVQVSTIDYPATLGVSIVQYHLTDSVINPPETQGLYSEQLVYLPIAMCYSPPEYAPEINPPPCLKNGYVTFAAFHRLCKLSPESVQLWARILQATPRSRLLLHHAYGNESEVPAVFRARVETVMTANGVSTDRLEWIGALPHDRSMALYQRADIALDSFPYSGFTTTAEALYMGVPVVSWYDHRPMSRHSLTMLNAVGVADLSVPSPEEYVQTAVRLAADHARLSALRKQLRGSVRTSPLCDAHGYARALEETCRRLYNNQHLTK